MQMRIASSSQTLAAVHAALTASLMPTVVSAAIDGANADSERVKLDELVVSATGYQQSATTAPASISVVTAEQLAEMPYREVTDALAEIPGVSVVTGAGNSSDISIRGMDPKYTLILVDGKRLSSRETRTSGGRFGNTSGVSEGGQLPPLESIQRIEVIRGPMSSLYGSDAMGGVVNIITKRVADKWSGSIRTNGTAQLSGTGDTWDANLYASGPLIKGRLGLQLSAATVQREESEDLGGSPKRKDESLSAKLNWTIAPQHDVLFEASHYDQETTSTPGLSLESTGTLALRDQERMVYSATHYGTWSFGTSESYVQYEAAEEKILHKEIDNTVAQTSFIIPLRHHTLNTGLYFRHQDLSDPNNALTAAASPTHTVARGATHDNWAAFVDDDWKIHPDLSLTGALRMDSDELYGPHWTPRFYVVYTPGERFTLKSGVAYGFRAPDIRQTLEDWGQASGGGNLYGNPNLQAETSQTYEFGANYRFDSGLDFGLTAYHTDFKDKIMRVRCAGLGLWCSTAGSNYTTYTNVDEAEIDGLEATAEAPLGESFSLRATGSLLDSSISDAARNRYGSLNDLPKAQASLALNWRPKTKPFTAYARLVFRGKESVPATDIVTNSGSSSLSSPAPSYTTVDIGGSWRYSKSLTFYTGVMNLLDKQIDYTRSSYTIDGVRVWAGVKASF